MLCLLAHAASKDKDSTVRTKVLTCLAALLDLILMQDVNQASGKHQAPAGEAMQGSMVLACVVPIIASR